MEKRKRNRKPGRLKNLIAPLVFFVCFIALWELYVNLSGISPDILPAPHAILIKLAGSFQIAFAGAMLYTLQVILAGYATAIPLGLALAAVCSQSKLLTRAITPVTILLVTIPMLTIVPLLTLFMGIVQKVRIIVVVCQAIPIICLNSITGFRSVEQSKMELFRSLGANRWQIFFKLQFPNALPQVFTGLKLGCIFSTIAAIGADLTAGNAGLGMKISTYSGLLATEMAYGGIILVAIIALGLFEIVARIEKHVVVWRK